MTTSDDSDPERETARDKALGWLRRLNSGEATGDDLAALSAWRAESPAHAREFAEAAMLWTLSAEAAAAAQAGATLPSPAGMHAARRLPRRAFLVGGGALAASVAGGLLVRPPADLWPSLAELSADYRTGTGQRHTIELARRVSVEMNTRSSLDLRAAADGVTEVALLNGEAAFAKAEAAGPDLVVSVGPGTARAAKASFNIRKDGPLVRVTCVAGEVEVRCAAAAAALRTGQQVAYDDRGLRPVAAADAEVVTAWQRGLLIFQREPLSSVIDEVNRYRSGRIVLVDRQLGRRQVVATFRLDRINDVIDFMAKAMNLPTRSLPGGIVLVG
ncbi:MAG: FecR domain-containing protein [Rhodoplanes sp.]|uniref:FecR family protein n=1 Tax=Rhodoplanes sp. TaxID=1968906 RepID=UPI0017D231A6|nr:FecR domain-containing protein [Rhodoplanes sp.]NVO13597.1 FecR domain-containing protein [Rhodoplanes sp.]